MKRTRKTVTALLAATLTISVGGQGTRAHKVVDGTETSVAGVLVGPCGSAAAYGPSGTDDDYSNANIGASFAMSPEGLTKQPETVIFKNTIQNIGSGDDVFVITAPFRPQGFAVEVSDDFGDHYVTLDQATSNISMAVAYRTSRTLFVRITTPSGLRGLSAYDTVMRAESTRDGAKSNETINRIYTGFVRVESTAKVISPHGIDDVRKAASGSEIEFTIRYRNISSAAGAGNSLLSARNLVINENGNTAPNSWGSTTEHIVGASDNQGGYIVGDHEGSTSLSNIVMRLDPGQSGVFKFRRRVK